MNSMKKLLIFLFCSAFAFAQKDLTSAEKFQSELNQSYADSLKSPLMKKDFKDFKGLDFFPLNEKYIVEAKFVRTKKEKTFAMKTTTSITSERFENWCVCKLMNLVMKFLYSSINFNIQIIL